MRRAGEGVRRPALKDYLGRSLITMADVTDPALYEGGIPKRISALASAAAYEAAFDATPIAGAFSHQIAPEGIWVGAQSAAGVLASFEDTPDERARCLAELRARRISVIICCCFDDDSPSTRIFETAGVTYASALLSDGSPASIAASVPAFMALVERAWPLVVPALARGDHVLVHCNSGMHRSASVALGLLMALRREEGQAGLARVFAAAVTARPVIRPTFWPLLESPQFAALCQRLRASAALPA